ncbi:phosphodiester glycosidase family protein [soil metagenome]
MELFKLKLNHFLIIVTVIISAIFIYSFSSHVNDNFVSYQVNLKKQDLKLYWKDDKGQPLRSLHNLKSWLETKNKTLVFAMNAGMYKVDNSPLGLFIENRKTISAVNNRTAAGNFYWKPNGILFIDTANHASICKTEKFTNNGKIKYATQSGPMLVFDGKIHPDFKKGSTNLNIRNGVGLLPDNELIFAMSKKEISLYDFAQYFLELGCKNALSFDGFVCRTYLPEKNWIQTDGDFGVIVGVTTSR